MAEKFVFSSISKTSSLDEHVGRRELINQRESKGTSNLAIQILIHLEFRLSEDTGSASDPTGYYTRLRCDHQTYHEERCIQGLLPNLPTLQLGESQNAGPHIFFPPD